MSRFVDPRDREVSAGSDPFVFSEKGVRALETHLLTSLRSYMRQRREHEEAPDSPLPNLCEVEKALERALHRVFAKERLEAPGETHAHSLEEIVRLESLLEAMSRQLSDHTQEIARLRGMSRAMPREPAKVSDVPDSEEDWPEAGPEKIAALARMFDDNVKLRAQFARPT